MKADPDAQRRLLDLQAIDTALAQLAHRRRTLPEHAELDRLAGQIAALDGEQQRAQLAVQDLDRDIGRLDRDVEQVRARAAKDQGRLDAGTAPPRELEALQREIESLARRQSDLEDAELELMERRETAQAELAAVRERYAAAEEQRAAARVRRDEALAQIAKEEQARRAEREPLAGSIPADLLALYDRIREASGGIGAALLRSGRCGGCRLELSGSDLQAVRGADPDEVVRCEECRRVLVRTAESGL